MKKLVFSLFVIIVAVFVLSACGAKPSDVVTCPSASDIIGECRLKPGNEAMVAHKSVPVALVSVTYVEVTAPGGSTLSTHVMFGYAQIVGEGTNMLRIYRVGQGSATVNVFVSGADYPVEVSFNGYEPYSQK